MEDGDLAHFFRCFTTPTGGAISPPALCVENTGRRPHIEELIAFRNVVMISALATGWSIQARAGQAAHVVQYSNALELYPCTVGRGDPKGIIWSTPTTLGWDQATNLHGQCSPRFPHPAHFRMPFDQFLFDGLMRAWRLRYRGGRRRLWLTRLFRSLQMAYMAMETPFSNQGTNIDWGTSSGLWVSAFEVLTHEGRSSYPVVADALENAPWELPRLAVYRRHRTVHGRGRNQREWRSLVARLYKRIYDLRNTVLHGNPMPRRRIDHYPAVAVLLYRGLLLRLLRDEVGWVVPELDYENLDGEALRALLHNRNMDEALIAAGTHIA